MLERFEKLFDAVTRLLKVFRNDNQFYTEVREIDRRVLSDLVEVLYISEVAERKIKFVIKKLVNIDQV